MLPATLPEKKSHSCDKQDAIAAQFFQSYPPVRIQNPQDFISLPDEALGILVEQDVVHGFRAAIVGFAIALR